MLERTWSLPSLSSFFPFEIRTEDEEEEDVWCTHRKRVPLGSMTAWRCSMATALASSRLAFLWNSRCRTGMPEKIPQTFTVVPRGRAHVETLTLALESVAPSLLPCILVNVILVAMLSPSARVEISISWESTRRDANASPLNPRVATSPASSSSKVTSLDVAWLVPRTAPVPVPLSVTHCALGTPSPSSATSKEARPWSRMRTSMDLAPASMLFSTSSLIPPARSSTTCPEQIRRQVLPSSARRVPTHDD
mmetsp:Transcript_3761/g.9529  ORF Transcript_3761/g.9529 Transcript_3761/m.9529 type:complete len:250 (-) Transcript_3761:210-959(-)